MARTQEIAPLVPGVYDFLLWIMSVVVDLFFREIHPRGSWKVPRRGPIMFVAAPHANQFVDPLILMRVLRTEARRRISILIAEKSMRRKFIGAMASAMGAIPVGRALDLTKPGSGKIYLPDPDKEPLLIRGADTHFDTETVVNGLLVLPVVNANAASAEIAEIISATEIRLKREFKGDDALEQLTGKRTVEGKATGYGGIKYKVAPKVDQTKVYDAVFDRLNHNGAVCIFPEGGSHDRTELLPLKPGVAIMALGSLAANPDSGLKIVPCGMNYFHAHKFRSRAVVEFGSPIEVPKELVDMYKAGERREATRQLLEIVYQALVSVTLTSPDYDTLMLVQAARRLYNPKGKKLPLPRIVELNRRLIQGYNKYQDEPRIVRLRNNVMAYNKKLWLLGLRDHQVEYAKFSIAKVVGALVYRLSKLAVMAIGTLPGLILFAPVFVAAKTISVKKSREALAASTVKLQGKDVMATWKLLVAMALAPTLYTFYISLLTWWTARNRIQGIVPTWVPLWLVIILGYIIFPMVTFAALRIGETGMDILKSLRPLVLSLNPTSANTLHKLRDERERLSAEVTEVINTLGPEMFDDFETARLIADPFKDGSIEEPASPTWTRSSHNRNPSSDSLPAYRRSRTDGDSTAHDHLPRNESFGNLGNLGLFATRPPSRSRSRDSSTHSKGSHGISGMTGFSMIKEKTDLEAVSDKIRGAMRERGKERRRMSAGGEDDGHDEKEEGWEITGSREGLVEGDGEDKKHI